MLKCENIRKTFDVGTAYEKEALCGVSFSLAANDFVAVIGGNGAGKSTVLNAVAGVFPVEGSIEIDGCDVSKLPEYARAQYIGRVFQDPRMGTAHNMTIEENLAIAYRRGKRRTLRMGVSRAEREFFHEHLKILGLGLENRMKIKTGSLSGGQRQALTLLMATIKKPKLLLLDEHTAALDPKTAKTVLELTNKIVRENKLTTLMVTHNMKDAINSGNRLMMMHEGNMILDVRNDAETGLTVQGLLKMFEQASGDEITSDRMLLG
jgi:putative ABC transport system ATP-binding protein